MVIFPTADSKEHHVNYIFVFWDITKYIRKHENDSTLSYLDRKATGVLLITVWLV